MDPFWEFTSKTLLVTIYAWFILFINFKIDSDKDVSFYKTVAWLCFIPVLNFIVAVIATIAAFISSVNLLFNIIFKK